MSLSVFMFLVKFLILMAIGHSVIFASAKDALVNVEDAPVGHQTRLSLTVNIEIVESDDWTIVSIDCSSSHKSLPKTKSQIFALLMSDDEEQREMIKETKKFIDDAYALKKEYQDKIVSKRTTIETTARVVLDQNGFKWGSISISGAASYKWRSEKEARRLMNNGLGYYNLALEVQSLLDDELLEEKYFEVKIDRAGLRDKLKTSLSSCAKLLQEINLLQEELDAISGPLPSPPHAYRNTSGGCF